ncbi:hypothetical protein O181_082093 [Austropuccinia psidii MF-1]|uniref:PH domain-containing protein n=1 Tax=Austropuccinia psidii MF-1 TaxID=1389203 RepID=A0A9Q3II53_9BASI|nr:hypothetical protein [Austropuccinia psidii MF-1]
MDGIPNEILEYIYDNVTYSQFIFVDHDKAVASQKLENSNGFGISLGTNSNGKDKAKLDPYQLISQGLTHELRPDIESVIPSRNPYSFTGSIHSLDFNRLRNSFGFDSVAIQVINPISTKSNSAIKQLVSEIILINKTSNGELIAAGDSNARLESGGDDQSLRSVNDLRMTWEPENNRNEEGALCLKAVKVGLVYRKDEGDGLIKNVTKKWKASCTLLTAGQLIFMKDLRLVKELQESLHQASIRNQQNPSDRSVVRITGLKPDSVFSLEDAIALMDSTYKRRPFTFRLILSKEHNFLMGVENEADMNSWITHINYAAAYKTNRLSFRHQFFFGGDGSQTKTSMSNSTNMSHIKSLTDGQQIISEKLNSGGSYTPFQESSLFDTESSRFQSSSERSSQRINAKNQFRVSGSTGGRTSSPPNSRRHSRDDQTSLASNINLENAKKKLLKLDSQILTAKNDLNEDLRLARNLAVLTPFQLSTRARLQQAIIPVADRIRTSRYALSKLLCYREILIRDFPLKPIRSRQNTLNQQVGLEKSPSNDENNKAGLACRTEAVEEKKIKIEVSDLREPLIEASNTNETVPRLDKNMINLQEAALPIELKEKLEETPGNPLKGKLEKYQVERKEGSQINKKTSVKADDGCQVLENQSKECRGYYTELANYRRSSSASKTSKAELLSEPIVERFGFKLRGRRLSGPVLMTEIGAELKQRRESPRRNSITDLMEGSSKFLSNLGLNSTKHPEGVQRSTSGFMKAIKQHSLTDFKMTNYNPECEADLSDEKRAKGDKKGSMMGSLTGCSIGYSRGLGLGESDLRATPTEGWHEGGGREENLINNNGGLKGLRFPKVLRRPTTSVASNSTHQQSIGSPNSSGNTLSKKTFKAIGAKSSTSQSNQSDSSNIIKSLNHSKRTSPITPISPSFTSNSTQQPYHSNGNPSIQNKRFTQAWGLP